MAAMKSQLFFLAFVLATVFSSAFGIRREAALLGGWKPIENLNDPHVKEMADFAVSEHNKAAKTNWRLVSVVHGEQQVVAGTNYKLLLETTDGKAREKFEAIVWEKPWQHFMNLTSFKPVKA